MSQMRLDKFLADLGIATRKELKQIIRSGRASVNGTAVTVPEFKLDPEKDTVTLDGERLGYAQHHYYIIDKPAGVVTATEDKKQPTVLDLFPAEMRRMGLFPVGRLDKDTSGLLIITDDGEYAHKVISPKSEIEKLYFARVDGIPDESDVKAFKKGIVLKDGTKCLPAKLAVTGRDECFVTVMEGKYHQVKRMLASRSKSVVELRRLSIGKLTLEGLSAPGEWRELTEKESLLVFE